MATTYMALTLPSVLSTPGPEWATQLNTAFTSVDEHDHTSGKGKQVPTAGVLVNADFPFNGYSASLLKSVKMTNQASALSGASNYNSVYVAGNELFFNDSAGNQVQITLGGAVNAGSTGNITGLSSPASASFSSGTSTFTWLANSGSNTLATMQFADAKLHGNSLSTNPAVTLRAAAATTSWSLTFPAAAASGATGIASVSTAGDMGYYYLDNVGLEASGTTLRIKDNGVTDSKVGIKAISTNKINFQSDLEFLSGTGTYSTGTEFLFTSKSTFNMTIKRGWWRCFMQPRPGTGSWLLLGNTTGSDLDFYFKFKVYYDNVFQQDFVFRKRAYANTIVNLEYPGFDWYQDSDNSDKLLGIDIYFYTQSTGVYLFVENIDIWMRQGI